MPGRHRSRQASHRATTSEGADIVVQLIFPAAPATRLAELGLRCADRNSRSQHRGNRRTEDANPHLAPPFANPACRQHMPRYAGCVMLCSQLLIVNLWMQLLGVHRRPRHRQVLSSTCHAIAIPACEMCRWEIRPIMTDLSSELGFRRNGQLRKAVYQNRALSRAGFSERLFALLFTGLVYPQIWEDPEVDIEAMDLLEGHRVVTIASGGCNVLAYLTRSPAHIDAVDLNAAHIALNRLKLAAVRHLPAQADLFRFFGEAGNRHELRRLRPLPRAASRRRRPAATGKSATGADAGASRPSTAISTAPACSACSSPPATRPRASTASTRAGILKAHDLREPAPLLRGRARPDLRPQADAAGAVTEIVAVRPRHSAGAVQFADRLRRRLDGERAEGAAGKARLRFPAERQLFRLAGLRAPLSRARRRRPARLSGQGELRDAARQMSAASPCIT